MFVSPSSARHSVSFHILHRALCTPAKNPVSHPQADASYSGTGAPGSVIGDNPAVCLLLSHRAPLLLPSFLPLRSPGLACFPLYCVGVDNHHFGSI